MPTVCRVLYPWGSDRCLLCAGYYTPAGVSDAYFVQRGGGGGGGGVIYRSVRTYAYCVQGEGVRYRSVRTYAYCVQGIIPRGEGVGARGVRYRSVRTYVYCVQGIIPLGECQIQPAQDPTHPFCVQIDSQEINVSSQLITCVFLVHYSCCFMITLEVCLCALYMSAHAYTRPCILV